jgi:hypothetical protein
VKILYIVFVVVEVVKNVSGGVSLLVPPILTLTLTSDFLLLLLLLLLLLSILLFYLSRFSSSILVDEL